MNVPYVIVPADSDHIPYLAKYLRLGDRREVWASSRSTPHEALAVSLGNSARAWTCLVNRWPVCMWGVARKGSILSDPGIPWLLGTDAIYTVERPFIRRSREYVAAMHRAGFARRENYVHAEHVASLRWLAWCGFTIGERVTFNGEEFRHFWRVR